MLAKSTDVKRCSFIFMYHVSFDQLVRCKFISDLIYFLGNFSKNKFSMKWYFVSKIVLTYCEKKNSSDREGREFARIFGSLDQFIRTVKGQNNF